MLLMQGWDGRRIAPARVERLTRANIPARGRHAGRRAAASAAVPAEPMAASARAAQARGPQGLQFDAAEAAGGAAASVAGAEAAGATAAAGACAWWPPLAAGTGSSGTISSATMLMILISGLTAGPAVSLYGSPTVSPVTAALCASLPLPPWWPSSMYFLALSQAPPPVHMLIATNRPVTIVPISRPPRASAPTAKPITIGTTTGSSDGSIISLIAAAVSMSTALPYSGLALPSMMPLISRNWRRTSSTTEPAARPTAAIAIAPNR